MRARRPAVLAIVLLGLSAACAPYGTVTRIEPIRNASGMADAQVMARYIRAPRPGRFSICHEHTCHAITQLAMSAAEWDTIRGIFARPAPDPAGERGQIALAIATLEEIVGAYTGTGMDQGLNLPGLGLPGQMDCVDEATNSSAYLLMLQNDGLMRWHRAGPRISRGILQFETPHFTATIVEQPSGRQFAVDSWFEANGQPPHVVPLPDWLRGWSPAAADIMAGEAPDGTLRSRQ